PARSTCSASMPTPSTTSISPLATCLPASMFLGWKSQAAGSTAGSGWRRGSSLGSSSAQMHIELIEMLRCPEEHREEFLVLSTSEMNGRRVWLGVVGWPVCHRDFELLAGVV